MSKIIKVFQKCAVIQIRDKNIKKKGYVIMAGINGFGANNFGNYGNNVNKAGQKAQNLKQQGVAGNQAESLTFKKTDSCDGFRKTETENDVQYAKKDNGGKTEKKDKKGFWDKVTEKLSEIMLKKSESKFPTGQNCSASMGVTTGASLGDVAEAIVLVLLEG